MAVVLIKRYPSFSVCVLLYFSSIFAIILINQESVLNSWQQKKIGAKGLGRKKTDESEHFLWGGNVKVPCGRLVASGQVVERMADIRLHFKKEYGKYKCNYCGHYLSEDTSITRLRAHLSKKPNAGTKICPKVPDNVRISLCEINKRQKTATGHIPRSSNLLTVETEVTTLATTSVLQPLANNYLGNQGQENHLRDGPIFSPEQNYYFVHHSTVSTDPNESASVENLFNQGQENHFRDSQIFSPEQNYYFVHHSTVSTHPNESASVEAAEPSEVVNGCTTQPVERGSTHQPDPLTTTHLSLPNESGTQAITPPNESCGTLESVSLTDLATQEFRNRCLTVDADQHGVGDAANQTGNNRVSPTADVLTDEADQNGVQSEGRVHVEVPSAEVSSVQRTRREALEKDKAWISFTQELGNYTPKVVQQAQGVCRECAGLTLLIRVMARSMNGICDVLTWEKTLQELKEAKVSKGHEMREEAFSVLKFSYLRLNNPALQECLSYCALFPEDTIIDRNDLIEYMIVEGIIEERKRRQGHSMLDTLKNACFLEGDTKTVRMHHLIRDMVILILREESKTLVEAGAQLKELPDVEKWTENLVRVSLISNDIEVIPPGYTPKCPNLLTLLLCRNSRLKMIADSFFEHFQRLKILDLTSCQEIEELPRSIVDLLNLTALLLRDCRSLIHVPSLAKLEKLKKLDLSGCEKLKQMPEDVRFLLKYLDLSRTGIEEIGSGIIPMLSQLQVLKLCGKWGDSELSFRGSEVGGLTMLETLHCRFSDPKEFGKYMKSREMSQQSPSDYSIFIERENTYWPITSRKCVTVTGCSLIDDLALPTDIETLNIYNCDTTLCQRLLEPLINLQAIRVYEENGEGRESLFSNYSTQSLTSLSLLNLKQIDICNCDKLKKLFPACLLPNLHNLQIISVEFCSGMEEIFSTDQEEEDGQELSFDQPNLTGLNLSSLTTLKLRHLQELRSIYKGSIICQSLEEIELTKCPKLQRITLPLPQPSLKRIIVYLGEWWDSVQWGSAKDKNDLKLKIIG